MGMIAYLVSEYPALSHTFIRREIIELRNYDLKIQTYSIRRPDKTKILNEIDLSEYNNTSYILPISIFSIMKILFSSLFRKPIRFLLTLKLAMRLKVPGIRGMLWSFFYFVESLVFSEMIRRNNISHIHNHFANSSSNVGLLASFFSEITWSLTLHGLADWTYPNGNTLALKLEFANFVACVSHYGKAQAYRITSPELWDKYFISRCGVNIVQKYQDVINRSSMEPVRILNIGRLSPEKGQAGLISTFSKVLRKGNNCELVVGGSGDQLETLKRIIDQEGIRNECRLLGQLSESDVYNEMQNADIFVLSSFMEGLPVVLMEALSLKLPVIAPSVAGIPELIIHEKTGLLFIPGDWDDLENKISELLCNRDYAAKLARNGYQHVVENFNINETVKPLLTKFKEMISNG